MSYYETTMRFHRSINHRVVHLDAAPWIWKEDQICTAVKWKENWDDPIDPNPCWYGYSWEGSAICFVTTYLKYMERFFDEREAAPNQRFLIPFDPNKDLCVIRNCINGQPYNKYFALLHFSTDLGSNEIASAYKRSCQAHGFWGPQNWIWEPVPNYQKIVIDNTLRQICSVEGHSWMFLKEPQNE